MTKEVNPCYGININNNDDDATYCEINETQSVTTSQLYDSVIILHSKLVGTDPNPCYGVNNESLFAAGVKSQTGGVGDEDDYI